MLIKKILIKLTLLSVVSTMSSSAQYDKIGITDESDSSQHSASFTIIRPGNGGFALRLPASFRETKHPQSDSVLASGNQSFYQYEYNGVRIQVRLTQYSSEQVANESVHPLLNNLVPRINVDSPIPTFNTVNLAGRKGIQLQYEYDMMPMGKVMVYRLLGLIDKSKVWTIIASYKACDGRGHKLVERILDSVYFTV